MKKIMLLSLIIACSVLSSSAFANDVCGVVQEIDGMARSANGHSPLTVTIKDARGEWIENVSDNKQIEQLMPSFQKSLTQNKKICLNKNAETGDMKLVLNK